MLSIRLILLISSCLVPAMAIAQTKEIDNLVTQWVQLEQQATALENQWHKRKPILQQQLALLESEEKVLSGQAVTSADASDDIELKRAELLEKQNALEKSQENMAFALEKTQIQLKNLLPRLPPPLSSQWEKELLLLDKLDNPSEILEKQLALLNSLDNFNQRIATHKTTLSFDDGTRVQVDQIYLGAAVGWYVSRDNQYWGTGTSSTSGWKWQHKPNDLTAEQIRTLLTSVGQGSQSRFVSMPVEIGNDAP